MICIMEYTKHNENRGRLLTHPSTAFVLSCCPLLRLWLGFKCLFFWLSWWWKSQTHLLSICRKRFGVTLEVSSHFSHIQYITTIMYSIIQLVYNWNIYITVVLLVRVRYTFRKATPAGTGPTRLWCEKNQSIVRLFFSISLLSSLTQSFCIWMYSI